MKVCKKCGRELDESQFSKNAKAADGLQYWCKECRNAYMKERNHLKREQRMIYDNCNPKLAEFTPRQLMEELKSRGYTGVLKYVQTINI